MRGTDMCVSVTAGLVVVSAMLGSFGSAQAQPSAQATPTFRAGVDLVSVAAVVRDRKGRVVRNLGKQDFEVIDQGRPRTIVDVSANDLGPTSLALLFDVSGSMQGTKIDSAKQAAEHVLSWLETDRDEAAVFTFDSQLREVQPFTNDRTQLRASFDRFEPFGATSLYDAIAETARRVAARTIKRRGILVVTDGVDTYSRLSPGEVSGIASSIDVPVYIFAIVSPLDHPGEENFVGGVTAMTLSGALSDLSRWTGGELFVISVPAHASLAARQLLTELRHQYLIAFESGRDIGWHRLEIRTLDRDLSVRTRSGYVAGQGAPVSEPSARGSNSTHYR